MKSRRNLQCPFYAVLSGLCVNSYPLDSGVKYWSVSWTGFLEWVEGMAVGSGQVMALLVITTGHHIDQLCCVVSCCYIEASVFTLRKISCNWGVLQVISGKNDFRKFQERKKFHKETFFALRSKMREVWKNCPFFFSQSRFSHCTRCTRQPCTLLAHPPPV